MNRTTCDIAQFPKSHVCHDIRHVYALDVCRSNVERLYLEHWRAGVVRSIPSKNVKSVEPLGIFLNNNPNKPLVKIEFAESKSKDAQNILSFGDPVTKNVSLIPYPSPPGGRVDNVQVVEFFSTLTDQVNCLFSNEQPEPPRRPLERMAALYKNSYFVYYDLLMLFDEASPTATVNLDFPDYYYAMAAFTRPRGSSANWQASSVSNIAVLDDRFVFTYVDCIFDGGVTGGQITIKSKVEIIFGS